MSSNPFLPQGLGLSFSTSTTSNGCQLSPGTATTICVTNRSRANAWIAWSNVSPPTAVFPVPDSGIGAQGMEVPPGMQLSIGTQNTGLYVSAILDSGTGVMTVVPGDGL